MKPIKDANLLIVHICPPSILEDKADARKSGRAPRAPLPQAEQSRRCALSLFYSSIAPAPPLALLHSAHTYLDLVAPACTPRPARASPPYSASCTPAGIAQLCGCPC